MKRTNMEKIWDDFEFWVQGLPFLFIVLITIAPVMIPIFVFSIGLTVIGDFFDRGNCLNAEIARRWSAGICEEYYNNEWIEIDLSRKVYYYNDTASRGKK